MTADRAGGDVTLIKDELAEAGSHRAVAGSSVGVLQALRRRMGVGVERGPVVSRITRPPADGDLLGVHRVAHDEVGGRRWRAGRRRS